MTPRTIVEFDGEWDATFDIPDRAYSYIQQELKLICRTQEELTAYLDELFTSFNSGENPFYGGPFKATII